MSKIESGMESMLDTFIFETTGLLDNLDEILIRTEKSSLSPDDIAEIFRTMHTIKGSAAMMGPQNMAKLAHSIEDLFYIIREDNSVEYDKKTLYELLFEGSDCLKNEIECISDDEVPAGDFTNLMLRIHDFTNVMKGITADTNKCDIKTSFNIYEDSDPESIRVIKVLYDSDCMMPEIRAMLLLRGLGEVCQIVSTIPVDMDDENAGDFIIKKGLYIKIVSEGSTSEIESVLKDAMNIESYKFVKREKKAKPKKEPEQPDKAKAEQEQKSDNEKKKTKSHSSSGDSIISVKLNKLDALLDLVGEIVITESMISGSPELKVVKEPLEDFYKTSRKLKKLTDELQDIVMSIRMVPVSSVFNKMNRVVRDMNNRLEKNVELVFEGETTEADKSVVDMLNDPLMHLVRNAVDHGIETPEERAARGKTDPPRVTLRASDESGEIVITVSDNGKGMDYKKLLAKASKNGILTKPENEYTEDEALNLIMKAGFSTNENVTEFSGRGVGMDVVASNIVKIGGKIIVQSKLGKGSDFILKIPLSLSIIDIMGAMCGDNYFCIPISSIKETFRPKPESIVSDNQEIQMVIHRGWSYPILRLSEIFNIEPKVSDISKCMFLLCQADGERVCICADEITESQSVVVKPFSPLLNNVGVNDFGMSGCSIQGDGSIAIILDVKTIMDKFL